MTQKQRILLALGVLVLIVAAVLGIDALQRGAGNPISSGPEPTVAAGSIPIYLNGRVIGSFSPANLGQLPQVSFTEPEENKSQEGWLLRDIILLHVQVAALKPDSVITVSSSSRGKSAQVTWAEADDPANFVMFDLANRGTLKLVSILEKLDTRDEWVQDVDKIEVASE